MIAILHNIRSTHNVGSMFRTAEALGLNKLYLTGYTPTPIDQFGRINKTISKVSLGAENDISWQHLSSIGPLIDTLKKSGFSIYTLELDKAAKDLNRIQKSDKKIALVVGNEVRGLSRALLKKSDFIIEIPLSGKKESLNVSVAFGIAIYALKKINI